MGDCARLNVRHELISLVVSIALTALGLYGSVLGASESGVAVVVENGHFAMAPAWIRVRVRVDRDQANRGLTVAALSDGFERHSYEQLDGMLARRTRWVEWPDVPTGEYLVVAVVNRGVLPSWRATARINVIAREGLLE